jgi:hypothetical protein
MADPTTTYIQKRFQDVGILTPTQQTIFEAATPGKVVIVYRLNAQHGKGCSFLAGILVYSFKWKMLHHLMSFKQLQEHYHDTDNIIVDCPCAFQFSTTKRKNFFNRIHALLESGFRGRMIVMMHGEPHPMHSAHPYTLINISDAPKAPY